MRILASVLSLALLFSLASAQPVTRTVPTQYATIQLAIQAASGGDTILVLPGTYVEAIDFLGKDITVMSRDGAAVTTIDANETTTAVNMSASGAPVLAGFTITGGYASLSGSASFGGGVVCAATNGVIRDNVIIRNSTRVIAQPGSRGNGGGVYVRSGSVQILRNVIEENGATSGRGGGILCSSAVTTVVIEGNTIIGNMAAWGGGVYAIGNVRIEGNLITGNRISGGRYSPYATGAGVHGEGAVTIRHNTIVNNLNAGAPYGGGGGIYLKDGSSFVTRNVIADNDAPAGGGMFASGGQPVISSNVFTGNKTWIPSGMSGGGGLYADDAVVTSNLFAGNEAVDYGGGVAGALHGAFVNNTIYGNTAKRAGGGYYTSSATPAPVVNCIVRGNSAPSSLQIGGSTVYPVVKFSNVEGGWAGPGNIGADPQFDDPMAGDFHLRYPSPCRGTGSAIAVGISAEDFEGDPRIVDDRISMGADAFYPHVYHTGRAAPSRTIRVKTVGTPGSFVVWAFSGTPAVADPPIHLPGYGDLYLRQPIHPVGLGAVPASGIASFGLAFPPGFPIPTTYPMQSLVFGGSRRTLTNVSVLTVESP